MHFEQGRQLWKAVQYRQRAAEHGFLILALQEVQEHLCHGLRLLELLPETPDRIQYELPMVTALGTEPLIVPLAKTESQRALQRARELVLQEDIGPDLLLCIASLAAYASVQAQYAEALSYGNRCLSLARQTHDPSLLGIGGSAIVFPLFLYGEYFPNPGSHLLSSKLRGRSLTANRLDKTLTLTLNMHPGISCLTVLSWSLWALGYPDQAREQSRQLVASHRDDYLPNQIASLCFATSLTHLCRDSQTLPFLCGTRSVDEKRC